MGTGNILIVDDDTKLRQLLKRIISLEGYNVHEAADLKSARKIIDKDEIGVVICDVKLSDGNGIDFIVYVKSKAVNAQIIILTAYANIADSVQAMKNGAFDYITKGEDNEKLIVLISHAFEKVALQQRLHHLEKQVIQAFSFSNIIGGTPIFLKTVAMSKKVAPTDTAVLLLGETGTGKELFAKAIHSSSKRPSYPFIALNCSSFSKDLLESELFGHKAGSFTGAVRDKRGLIEEAEGGTLFLDEIGEMDIAVQAKFLRVIETNEYMKLGDTRSTSLNVRIISATNRDLYKDVSEGVFRADLFYRLNVFCIKIPPLRDRKKDIPLLATYFLMLFAKKMNKSIDGITKELMAFLVNYHWRGNIRELKNIIERAVLMSDQSILGVENLPYEMQVIRPDKNKVVSVFNLANMEKCHINKILHYTSGNKAEAAKLLNIGLTTIYRKMKAYDLH